MRKPRITDPNGQTWKYFDYESDRYGITAIYQNVDDQDDFCEVPVEFEPQEYYPNMGEYLNSTSGPQIVYVGDHGFDHDQAEANALAMAHHILSEKGGVQDAA